MTVNDIVAYVKDSLGVYTTSDAAVGFINDALKELGVKIRRFATKTYTDSTKNTWYDLPDGSGSDPACIKVHEARDNNDDLYLEWQADENLIKFSHSGTFKVRYYRVPNSVTSGASIPDCHIMLQQALAYYVAYRAEKRPGDNDSQSYLAEYGRKVNETLKQIQGKTPRRVRTLAFR